MGYSKETYKAAREKLAQRKREAEQKAEEIKENFLKMNPEGRVLLDRIGSAGSKAAIAVLKGGNVRAELEKLKEENLRCQREFENLLKANGLTREDISPQYACKKCGDTGYVDGVMCSCLKELVKIEAYKSLNQISPLQISTFESFSLSYYDSLPQNQKTTMVNTFRYCKQYAENFTREAPSLIFQGGTGLGKTHLSLAIAGVVIEKGYGVIYGSVHSFASAIERQRFGGSDEEDTAALLSSADLVILDDLGTEFPSPYVSSTIYNIIDTRGMKNLPTIISTNLTAEEIQKRYGERLVSRIFGSYNRFVFVGKDIRLAKRGIL